MSMKASSIMKRYMDLDALIERYYHLQRFKGAGCGHPMRGQGRVLSILQLKPEISQKELAFMLDMRKQSMGEILTKLEAKGYIVRKPNAEDQRAMDVSLTPEGAAAAAEIDSQMQEQDDLFDVLSDEEQEQLIDYLDRLIASMARRLTDVPEQEEFENHPKGHHSERYHHDLHGRRDWNPGRCQDAAPQK